MTDFGLAHNFELVEVALKLRGIGNAGKIEKTCPQGPPILGPFARHAIAVTPGVRRVIERARIDQRPIEEIAFGVVRIGVGVENIGGRYFPRREDQIVRRPRTAQLIGAGLDIFHLAAQIETLTEEQPLQPEIGTGLAHLIGLATGKARRADRVAEAKALVDLGIGIGLSALPKPHPRIQRQIDGLPARAFRVHAVGTEIGGLEGGVILFDERRLAMEGPGLGPRRQGGHGQKQAKKRNPRPHGRPFPIAGRPAAML